ncbi:uncharacterized protein LOC123672052 isoform X1 [Harmonia axyridis]|uniref:uncharacterized protein LOC123672052 isoform X1 n=1 Tax=Harmonia axyridis TaxID=115357 RepID=UPI001E279540|nr:uncharacterized protein LOC123672052 isoform X1 [Harmonia axyridis]XP_045461973.1 uncharacterized protein LOC123672052 isoform X1 [Harmonia axyridis]
MAKRVRYETKNKFESIDSSEGSDDNYNLNQLEDSSDPEVAIEALNYQSRRKPKCFSKNAQMARQNRLKKKIHLAKLEKKVEILKKEKNDLNNIIHAQSNKLSELKKEVRYLKGVLVNSSDIRTLVRNIHESTGMPVSSSLSNRLKECWYY